MVAYFGSSALLMIGLSMVRIAYPEKQAGPFEVLLYRLAIAWFVLLTMVHVNVIAALFYGFLFPWTGNKAIDAFPWQWFGQRERIIGWLLVVAGAIALFLTARYTEW